MQRGNEGYGLPEWLPVVDVPGPGRQRRLTVLVRYLLLVPQFIVVLVLNIGVVFVLVVGWFGALFAGRLPQGATRYLTNYLGYTTRVNAAAMLLVDHYPPFTLSQQDGYPVRIEVQPGTLNRWAVLFRFVLAIPAAIVAGLATLGWYVASPITWLVVLILGRMPRALFEATAAVLRFNMRCSAYYYMLASAYPKKLFGDAEAPEPAVSATRPLLMSTAGKVILVLFLLLGLAYEVMNLTQRS